MGLQYSLTVDSRVAEVLKDKEESVKQALEAIGLTAEAFAKMNCPVGTPESTGIPGYIGGTLRNSITHEVDGHTVIIGTNVEYGKYVELGTSNPRYPRQPYLQPAIEEHMAQYQDIFETTLKE